MRYGQSAAALVGVLTLATGCGGPPLVAVPAAQATTDVQSSGDGDGPAHRPSDEAHDGGNRTEEAPSPDESQLSAAAYLARGLGAAAEAHAIARRSSADADPHWGDDLTRARPLVDALTALILDLDPEASHAGPGEHPGWGMVDAIISMLAHDDPGVRYGARWSLRALAPIAEERLRKAAGSDHPLIRAGTQELLFGRRGAPAASTGHARSSRLEERARLHELASTIRERLRICAPREALLSILQAGPPRRAERAASELGRAGDPSVVVALHEAFLAEKRDGSLKCALARALSRIGGPVAFEAVRKTIENGSAEDFAFLLDAIPQGREDLTWREALLDRALRSPGAHDRVSAIWRVRSWDSPELLVRLRQDADPSVRAAAAQQLVTCFAKSHPGKCHAAIVAVLNDESRCGQAHGVIASVRSFYADRSRAAWVPEVAGPLLRWLEIETPPAVAIGAAAALRHRTLLKPLVALLDHREQGTRNAAVTAVTEWARDHGYRSSGNTDEEMRAALKSWITAHPGFVGREPEPAPAPEPTFF